MGRVAWTVSCLSLAFAMGCPPDEVETPADAGTDQSGDPSGTGTGGGADNGGGGEDPDLCAAVRCKGGFHCEVTEVQCITEPCPPIVECVPDTDETGPGCELIDCLPEYTCVEDADGVGSCVPVGGGVSCGKNTCAEGKVCCNESCGICTPPGGSCIKLYCGDETPACDLKCEPGSHCELTEVQCLVAPCDPVPECVPDQECTGPIIDCAAPPPGCNYEGGGCVDGNWTCGKLVCGELCGDVSCDVGQHCEKVCLEAASKPALVAPIPLPCELTPVCVDDDPCAVLDCASCKVVDGKAQCGTPCGDNTCLGGQECCNASCGTCVDPGFSCIQIACDSSSK